MNGVTIGVCSTLNLTMLVMRVSLQSLLVLVSMSALHVSKEISSSGKYAYIHLLQYSKMYDSV